MRKFFFSIFVVLLCVTPIGNVIAQIPTTDSLISQAKADQLIRRKLARSQGKDSTVMYTMASQDSANTMYLRSLLRGRPWFDVGELTAAQETAAFTLLQHSTDHKMQEIALPNLRQSVDSGRLKLSEYAMLEDRVLIFKDLPQLYGTQMRIVNEKLEAYPVDDPVEVDKRRKQIGLPPLNEFLEMANKFYQQQSNH